MGVLRRLPTTGLILVILCSSAAAQTLQFKTNVGSFNMRLNPTNDPDLRPLVDNILAYVGLGRYTFSAINRAFEAGPGAEDDFVLQMGSLLAFPTTPDLWAPLHTPVDRFSPVTVDADNDGQVDFAAQSNVRGTVSLALQQGQPNSGTSSFFINLGDNSSILDSQGFVPFATIQNMGTVNQIMRLMQQDLSAAAGASGSPAYTDVPIAEDGQIVILETVTVLNAAPNFSFAGPIATALQLQQRNANSTANVSASALSTSAAAIASEAAATPLSLPVSAPAAAAAVAAVPEPSAIALSGLAALTLRNLRRRR
jgi:cyclophilin family peptidyl-prolyl cis-trans isomerase